MGHMPFLHSDKNSLVYTYLVFFSKTENHFMGRNLVFRIREVSPSLSSATGLWNYR